MAPFDIGLPSLNPGKRKSHPALIIRFTDAERALLARKAKALGRKALLELDTLVSPDTLMRWHRRLVAQKWDSAGGAAPAVRASCARSPS